MDKAGKIPAKTDKILIYPQQIKKVYERNRVEFVILSGDKVHWLAEAYGFIFHFEKTQDSWFRTLSLEWDEYAKYNDFIGGR